ncbi:MAG: hypothetical protein AB7O32_19665, partial [Vicinamibacterales bacterium]
MLKLIFGPHDEDLRFPEDVGHEGIVAGYALAPFPGAEDFRVDLPADRRLRRLEGQGDLAKARLADSHHV